MIVCGRQGQVDYLKTLHTRIQYFSREHRALVIDNLMPFEEISVDKSSYLIGRNHDTLKIIVVITPFHQSTTHESPPLDFK